MARGVLTAWNTPTRYGPQPAMAWIRWRGFTLSEIARDLGYGRQRLSNIIHGVNRPTKKIVVDLATKLDCRPADLFDEEVLLDARDDEQ